ncbi:MAG: carbamoyltransferase HypF [Clostridiales bacterium]|jgi:hydrogenase maturation protein HypF|nr:carbamoyltransferase HypF [Clostridiales bacterium]
MAVRLPGQRDTIRVRRRVEVTGLVQGVGFRPYVYREAKKRSLYGWVLNNKYGVVVEIEGPVAAVDEFLTELRHCPLRLACISDIRCTNQEPVGDETFLIRESAGEGEGVIRIPADVAVCPHCRADVQSLENRRYHYPFTNCTDCGPRYTIIESVPYDRNQTTMSQFTMCEECTYEYLEPLDRRFHAQPNACPKCGPQAVLQDGQGETVAGYWRENALSFLKAGHILAVKGLGGFHLACDANNPDAVELLRSRKGRPARPFAVMCRNIDLVRRHCNLNETEEILLNSPESPIVVLRRRSDSLLPGGLAPGSGTLGVMIPYTPLHFLLFDDQLEMLVMTSGNESGLPLVKDSEEALRGLGHVADFFLTHDRPIHRRCDDSLLQVVEGEPCMLRRSRGYVPTPLPVPVPRQSPQVFAAGGDYKNTFCLLKDGFAYLGPHIGDLAYAETRQVHLVAAKELGEMLEVHPTVVAFDHHPGYYSSVLARQQQLRDSQPVWHHHAHLASCMGENMLTGPVIGVICDGTGYGQDGTIWGGEVLSGDYRDFQREYHLEPVPIPGGEGAVRYPWRMAASYLWHCLGEEGITLAAALFPDRDREINLLHKMLEHDFNSPLASSCGRLYDTVAALLGVCRENTYDGQAPMELAEVALGCEREAYPFSIEGKILTCKRLIHGIAADLRQGRDVGDIAASFEKTVVEMFAAAAERVRQQTGLNRVVLSGGSFQNPYLLTALRARLRLLGFQIFTHKLIPANDGGLALGQALVAVWRRSDN